MADRGIVADSIMNFCCREQPPPMDLPIQDAIVIDLGLKCER